MVAATEAFPYELLEIEGNQQSHYRATKTISEKRKQRAKRVKIVMAKLKEVIAECEGQDRKLEQANIEKSVEMGEELLVDVKDKTGVVLSQIDILRQIMYGELRSHKEEAKVEENLDVMIENEHDERDALVTEIRDIIQVIK